MDDKANIIGPKPPCVDSSGARNEDDDAVESWMRRATWDTVLRKIVGMERRLAALEGRKPHTNKHRRSRMEPT